MQVVQRLLEGEDGELKVSPDHFWGDRGPIELHHSVGTYGLVTD